MKNYLKSIALAGLTIGLSSVSQAQQQATILEFPNEDLGEHEYGYSAVECGGYSVFGTEFNRTINVFRYGQFYFQAVGPQGSQFGHALGMTRNWIAAGAPSESYNSGYGQGAVYLSKSHHGNHTNNFNVKIYPLTPADYDNFGDAIDMENEWLIVGASGGGYIEIWKDNNGSWQRTQKIVSPITSGNSFGTTVAIRGQHLVVGDPDNDLVYLYKINHQTWTLADTYTPNMSTWGRPYTTFGGTVHYTARFGWDVDITYGYVIVGDPAAEKAAILSINNDQLSLAHTLLPPGYDAQNPTFYGQFGHAVAILYNRALVGAPIGQQGVPHEPPRPEQGKVHMYTDGYQYKGHMYVGEPDGYEVKGLGRSIAIDEDQVLAGAEYTDNFDRRLNEGVAFRMPFWYVYSSGHLKKGEQIISTANETLVYPSPTKGNTVTIETNGASVISIEAISAMGEATPLNHNSNQAEVNTLNPGVYHLNIQTSEGLIIGKFVKQ